ncbi:GNAT family N-acetyltransferase [Streptomyces sp. NPDC057411]|uniref:GNAT family N-acetyltransferase n=1 Tax=unclassified Streptomyces TaxID=2593676 RepID=UPI00362EFD44
MQIREAGPSDAAAVAAVHVRSWQAAYRGLVPDAYLDSLDVGARAEVWRDRLAAPDAPSVLVAEEDAVVAFACFRPSPDGERDPAVTAELSALYAVPEVWGRGVGRELLGATVGSMAAAGFREAVLWVFEANSRARAFYEAAGWRPDGTSAREETGGRKLTELRYWRPDFPHPVHMARTGSHHANDRRTVAAPAHTKESGP